MPGSPGRFHIPSLDGLRAVAIALVFLSHAGLSQIIPGGFGVTVFFLLSGYLITTLLRREHERTGAIDLKHFYLRRVLRIWPAFYIVWLAGVVGVGVHLIPGEVKLWPALSQAFHLTNYYIIADGFDGLAPGSAVYWSLAIEEHFYLVFPFAYALMLASRWSARRQLGALLAACMVVLLWRAWLVAGTSASFNRTYCGTDTRLDNLLFGCALAVWGNPVLDGPPRREALFKRVVLPLAVLCLLGSFVIRSEAFRETFRYTLQAAALVPIFIAAISYPGWGVFRVLNLSWVRWLGGLSYAFYLVHHTVIETVRADAPAWPAWLQGVSALAVSLAIAWTLGRWVESPLARVRHSLAANGAPSVRGAQLR